MRGRYESCRMSIYGSVIPGGARLARLPVDLSADAKRRLKWLEYAAACGDVQQTCPGPRTADPPVALLPEHGSATRIVARLKMGNTLATPASETSRAWMRQPIRQEAQEKTHDGTHDGRDGCFGDFA